MHRLHQGPLVASALATDSSPRNGRPSILMASVSCLSFWSPPEGFCSSLQPLHVVLVLTSPHLSPPCVGFSHRVPLLTIREMPSLCLSL